MSSIVETMSIGKNFILGEFSVVRKCVTIGDDTEIREHCVIGSIPYNFTDDGKRILETGKVIIGNNVYISCFSNIAMGTKRDTIIEDNVLINSYVMVGHDVHVHKNVELMNYVNLSGYSTVGEDTFIGIGAKIRNRVNIGKNTIIGMGSVVVKDIPDNVVAYGNPCRVIGSKPNAINSLIKKATKKIGRLV